MKFSGKDLSYFDEERKERFVPHVVEPSAGADRATLAFLCEAYTEDEVGGETRTVLKFHPRLAPIKAAVFPLVKRDGMPEKAEAIYRELKRHFNVFYDEKGAIGRRYRRQDEAGTPFCITVDSQTPDRRHRHVPRPRQLPAVARARRRASSRPSATCSTASPSRRVLESVRRTAIAGQTVSAGRSQHSRECTARRSTMPTRPMKPCISQATTLSTPLEADLPAFARGGWTAVELWLTKLEIVPRGALDRRGCAGCSRPTAWSRPRPRGRGACCSRGATSARPTGATSAAGWRSCRSWESRSLIVAADFAPRAVGRRLRPRRRRARRGGRAGRQLRRAARARVPEVVRLLRQPRHDAGPDRPVRLEPRRRLPRPVPLLHRARASSRTWPTSRRDNLAWVQVCDLSGTPRELAGDSDRILPGEGDFQLGPILDHLGRIGYDGSRLARGAQPSALAGPRRPGGRPGLSGALPGAGTMEPAPAGILGRSLSVSTVATIRPAATVFREEQYFDWRVYALIAALELVAGYWPGLVDSPLGPRRRPPGSQVVARVLPRPARRPGPALIAGRSACSR